MALVIGTILSFVYLDPPWRYLAILPLAAFEGFEVWLYFYLRGKKSIMGPESLVGAPGRVVEDCTPEGLVQVRGQIWKGVSPDGARRGDEVVVTEVDGMRLTVAARARA